MNIAELLENYSECKSVYTQLRHRLADANPTPGSWGAEPLSLEEIDKHPDADRIWSTLLVLRGDK